jgi:hypothetical protein
MVKQNIIKHHSQTNKQEEKLQKFWKKVISRTVKIKKETSKLIIFLLKVSKRIKTFGCLCMTLKNI